MNFLFVGLTLCVSSVAAFQIGSSGSFRPSLRSYLRRAYATELRSEKTDAIVDQLKELTLVEASELVKKIEETFGVDASAAVGGGMMMMAPGAAAGGGDGEAAPAAEEKTEFDVVLDSVDAAKRIAMIKVLRKVNTELGLKEAKELVDNLPKPVLKGIEKEKAEETKKALEEAGGKVSIK